MASSAGCSQVASRGGRFLVFGDTRGGSYIEYLIVIGVVAIVAQLAFRKFGSTVRTATTEQAQEVALVGGVDYGCVGTLCLTPASPGATP